MDARTCLVTITGLSPYSPSRPFQTARTDKFTPEEHDRLFWREHMHVDADGQVVVPAMAFKQAIDFAAQRLGLKKKGNALWTADIKSGLATVFDMVLHGGDGRQILATLDEARELAGAPAPALAA